MVKIQRRKLSSQPNHRAMTRSVTLALALALPLTALGQSRISVDTPAAPRPTGVPAQPAASKTPAPPPAAPADPLQGLPIARVEVVGNNQTDTAIILGQVRAQVGQLYSRPQVDVDVRSIAALERFITVKAEVIATADNQVVVRYLVQERPIVSAVEIVGNRHKTDEEIRDLIAARGGGPADPFIFKTDIRALEELYKRDGYALVSVTIDPEALKKGIARYRIVEGPEVKIRHIRFDGNASVKSDLLKWKIKTKTYIWIFRQGALNEDDLSADEALIRDVYQSKGFLDARASHVLEYNENKSRVTVRFIINEGPKYKIGQLSFKGETIFTQEQLTELLSIKPGDYAEREKIEATEKRIADRYGHNGYIYSKVAAVTSYADTPAVVDMVINITEGKSYQVGRVIVRGNPTIEDRVIRREIRIYPDQTYDTVLVKKSTDRLKALRIFEDVKVTPIGNEPDRRDALVEVQEGQTARFLIGAGISTNSGLLGQISLEQQNFDITNPPASAGEFFRGQSFKGAGQYFRILLEPGTEVQRYRVTFAEPFLFDTAYSFNNDFYFYQRDRESFTERRLGDIVTLGRRFGDVWSTTLGFRGEEVWVKSVQEGAANEIKEAGKDSGAHFLTSIKPGVVRDTTDSRIFPTTGTKTSLAVEQYGAMGGEYDFTKVTTGFSYYIPVYADIFDRKTVFNWRSNVDFIPHGDSPFFERFYGGGIGSLRGFKFRGVSPRVKEGNRDPVGGDFSFVSTGELNYPIYEEILRGVVFVDVGDVESSVAIRDIRSDIGSGLRIAIPFLGSIPLALDFAVPVSKKDGDRTQVVSFSLGVAY